MDLREYIKPQYYCNRELSWMGFNERVLSEARDKSIPLFERLKFLSITASNLDERVLSEARDKSIPLFERLKFLSITASNLDEFFMIRVASLKDMVHAKYTKPDIAGLSPKEQLAQLAPATRNLIQTQYSTYNRSLLPALKKEGLIVVLASSTEKGRADRGGKP